MPDKKEPRKITDAGDALDEYGVKKSMGSFFESIGSWFKWPEDDGVTSIAGTLKKRGDEVNQKRKEYGQ